MGHAIDTLRTFLRENDFEWRDYDDAGDCARIGWLLDGKAARYEVNAVDIPSGHLWLYVAAPVRIPERLRRRTAELLALLNFGLRWGAFELDLEDGELRLRCSSLVPQGDGGNEIVGDLYRQCSVMDDFFALLMECAFSSDPVDVTYRRLYSAGKDGGEKLAATPADVSEVLEAVAEIGRQPPQIGGELRTQKDAAQRGGLRDLRRTRNVRA